MPELECPICRRRCPPRGQNRAYPFCSHRCQMIDLSRWLDEEYCIPGTPVDVLGPEDAPLDPKLDDPASLLLHRRDH